MHENDSAAEHSETGFIVDVGSLYAYYESLEDQRDPRGLRYPLPVALTMITLAKLGGEDQPRGMAGWLRHRRKMLAVALRLARDSTPHHTTISRILGGAVLVDPFERAVGEFFGRQSEGGQEVVLAIDGKTLRGTIESGETHGLHLLAAYLPGEGVVLMQMEVDRKENEIVAAPRVLECLDLRGKVVIGDALHTQRGLSVQIVDAGGDYIWTVKDNHPRLRDDIQTLFEPESCVPGFSPSHKDFRTATTLNKGHGRIERRTITVSNLLNEYLDWPGLVQVFKLERRFKHVKSGKVSQETIYGITSLSSKEADPEKLLSFSREYWGIENGLHYRRDVTFKEDSCRLRTGHAARVMAILNNLVLGLILKHGFLNVPDARRKYCACPLEALDLIVRA